MKSSRINVPAWHFLSFYSTSADRIGMKPWRAETAALSLFCDLLDPMLQVWSTYSCQCVSVNSTCRLVSVNVSASRTPGGLCGSPWISARIKNLTGPLLFCLRFGFSRKISPFLAAVCHSLCACPRCFQAFCVSPSPPIAYIHLQQLSASWCMSNDTVVFLATLLTFCIV